MDSSRKGRISECARDGAKAQGVPNAGWWVLMRVLSHTVSPLKNVTGVALERVVVKDRLHVDGSSGRVVCTYCAPAVLFNKLGALIPTAAWLQGFQSAHHLRGAPAGCPQGSPVYSSSQGSASVRPLWVSRGRCSTTTGPCAPASPPSFSWDRVPPWSTSCGTCCCSGPGCWLWPSSQPSSPTTWPCTSWACGWCKIWCLFW